MATTIRAFPREKAIVQRERSKGQYAALPYFLSKVVAEAPAAVALSALFGGLLYPLVGLQRSPERFANFLALTTLNSLAAAALGLLLGAAAPSTDAALAMFPPIVVLMIIFNGFNISEESTPKAIRWLPKLSVIRWAFEGLCVNEFKGLEFKPEPGRPRAAQALSGDDALARVAFEGSSVRTAAIAQAAILGGCYAQTYRILLNNKPRYAKLRPPPT